MKLSNSFTRRTIGALVLAALTIAPMFAVAPPADAQPRYRYGYRRNRTVVERYRRPTYRPYRRSYVRPYRRPSVAPRGRYTTRYRNGRSYRVYGR